MEVVEFICEGCGAMVEAYGIYKIPSHGFCVICEWLNENIKDDPERFWNLYKALIDNLPNDIDVFT